MFFSLTALGPACLVWPSSAELQRLALQQRLHSMAAAPEEAPCTRTHPPPPITGCNLRLGGRARHAACWRPGTAMVLPPASVFPRGLLPAGLHCLPTPMAHPAPTRSALTFWAPGPWPRVLLVPRAPSHVLRASAARPTLLPALCGEPGTVPGCLGAQPGQGELSSGVCVGGCWSEAGAKGGSEPQVPGGQPPLFL